MHGHEFHRGMHELVSSEYARAASLFSAMDRLRRVWACFRPEPPLKRSDLAMLGAIQELAHCGDKPVTVSMLAHLMKQSKPGISQKVSLLEEAGYLCRVADKQDRRMVCLELTPKGKETAVHSLQEFLGRVEEALNDLGEEKTQSLLALMGELSNSIEKVQSKEDNG